MELLSPAGSMASALAAIRAGADAIYIGVTDINHQRSRCQNFDDKELRLIVKKAHLAGVKVHVTFNSSYNQDNFKSIVEKIRSLDAANIDGLIISDIGLAKTIHQEYPSLPLMFSVQGQCGNSEFARLLKDIGISRVILDRNISIDEAIAIKENAGIEVEMFLFGYLCYSQDSICYMGDYFCEEPCNVMCAQKVRISGKSPKRHFFMKYMSGLKYIPKLIDSGVDCVKIEGRQRSSDYVTRTTKVFREAIDTYNFSKSNGTEFKIKRRWIKELRTAAFDFELTDAFYEEGAYKRKIIEEATLKNKMLYLYDCLYTFAETGNTIKLAKELKGSIKLDWLTPPVKTQKIRKIDAFK